MATEEEALALGDIATKATTEMLTAWARSFPIRRLRPGYVAGVMRGDLFVEFDDEIEFVVRSKYRPHDQPVERFDRLVRDRVGDRALLFRTSPEIVFGQKEMTMWMRAYVIDRDDAAFVGESFNREIGVGPRRWRS